MSELRRGVPPGYPDPHINFPIDKINDIAKGVLGGG